MDTAELVIRVLLAVVFATAGVGKLLDLQGSRSAMRDFGVPERLTALTGTLLPIAELAAAVALIFKPTATAGAVLALLLLLGFIAGIGNALRKGMAPDCHCFGQIHSAPAGPETLIRNGVLAALALFAVINGPGPAIDSWVSDRSGAEVAAGLLGLSTALLAIFALQLWTEVRQLRTDLILARNNAARSAALAPPGLPIGTEAPDFSIQSMEGETVSLADLRAPGLPVLILFTSPNCGSCTEIFPSLRRWQQTLASRLTIAVLTTGDAQDNQVLVDNYGLERLLLQPDGGAIIEAYRVRGTPTAVLVDPEGKIASIAAESVFEIEPMVRHVLRGGADGNSLQVSQHGATA